MAQGARTVRRILVSLLVLTVLAGGAFTWINRTAIRTYLDARSFHPSAQLSQLEDELSLTAAGSTLFRASHPTLDGGANFSHQCADVDHSEAGHVLGCFTSEWRIHLFDVDDERLAGIVEVTAAHELMHAAWARLPRGDRAQLSEKLYEFYHSVADTDTALAERMAVYEHLDRSRFANEMHSVFATEVRELPDWLETHYATWLSNREHIVDLHDGFRGVFSDLQARADAIQEEMHSLREEVDAESEAYSDRVATFNRDVRAFNDANARYEFQDDPAAFEAGAAALRERERQLKNDLEEINGKVDRYETLRVELKALSDLSLELDRELQTGIGAELPDPVNG